MQLNQEMEKTEERYVLFIYMMQCYDIFCRMEFIGAFYSLVKKEKELFICYSNRSNCYRQWAFWTHLLFSELCGNFYSFLLLWFINKFGWILVVQYNLYIEIWINKRLYVLFLLIIMCERNPSLDGWTLNLCIKCLSVDGWNS
jgi:hypothetical protein